MTWEVEYREAMRAFIAAKGEPVAFEERSWGRDVSPYGWRDYDKNDHCRPRNEYGMGDGCTWVVPEGSVLTEEEYSMFQGTFADNSYEVGVNVSGCHCACKKYENVTLRFAGSLDEVLRFLLGTEKGTEVVL